MTTRQFDRECAYLRACLADFDGALTEHVVDSADLETSELRTILDLIRARHARGERLSMAWLEDATRSHPEGVRKATGYLGMSESLPDDVGHLAGQLRASAVVRRTRPLLREAIDALDDQDLSRARDRAAAVNAMLADTSDRVDPAYAFNGIIERTVLAMCEAGASSGRLIALGTPTLDRHYLASPGTCTVIGASTNVGKSSLLASWALSLGARGIPVGIVSVEDPVEDFGAKALAALGSMRVADAWQGHIQPEVIMRKAGEVMRHDLPVHFAEVRSRRVDAVLSRMEQLVRGHGVRIVLVDYLQAIAHRDGKDLRERTDRTLEELIACAGRLDVPLVLASQLSRIGKQENRREPVLNDLKESGSIENRAAAVVLLWRASDEPGAATLGKIAKLKRGGAGVRFKLVRDPSGALIEDPSEPLDDEQGRRRRA